MISSQLDISEETLVAKPTISLFSEFGYDIANKQTIPQLFWFNALINLPNGSQAKIGSMTVS